MAGSVLKTTIDDATMRLDITLGEEGPGQAVYPVFLGENAHKIFSSHLREHTTGRKAVLIADENTADLFGLIFETQLITAGFEVLPLTLPAGETTKSWKMAGILLEELARNAIERDDILVSLGGGVVSDLVGFVASIYLRGVPFAQISTSLLSMVDASVGGKTAVDLDSGKNLAGSFKQPLAILVDTDTLSELPDLEFISGMGEVLKTALLDGEEFCAWLEESRQNIFDKEPEALREMIERCITFKGNVVAGDAFDRGDREQLNYGHTLGHAIETSLGYGSVTHGAAVAQGMRFAARIQSEIAGASDESILFIIRQDRLLDEFGVERVMPEGITPDDLMTAIRSDKKVRSGEIRMVLVSEPGQWRSVVIDQNMLYDHLRAYTGTEPSAALLEMRGIEKGTIKPQRSIL